MEHTLHERHDQYLRSSAKNLRLSSTNLIMEHDKVFFLPVVRINEVRRNRRALQAIYEAPHFLEIRQVDAIWV